jgi:hypothetical protein
VRKRKKSGADVRAGTRLLAFLSGAYWQALIAALITAATLLLFHRLGTSKAFPLQITLSDYLTLLGLVGAILALASSIAFGFLLYFISDATNRKFEAYSRLQDSLKDLSSFLNDAAPNTKLATLGRRFSLDLRALRLTDFPLMDWDERIEHIVRECTAAEKRSPSVSDELMVHLAQCEELVSTIGIMSIKQIVARVEAAPFIKSFVVLAAILISGVGGPFIMQASPTVGMAIPVFFCVLTSLVFVEIAWKVYRETNELLDFIEQPNE